MANVDIRVGKKDAAFFSANPTLILKDGQFLFNSDTLELFIGDGVTALSALSSLGGTSTTPTLQQVTNAGATTTVVVTAPEFNTPNARASIYDYGDGVNIGARFQDEAYADLFEVDGITGIVTYKTVEIAKLTDIPTTDATIINGSTNPVAGNAVFDALALKANLASPALTGTPTAPTATIGTNSTQIATTEFVVNYNLNFINVKAYGAIGNGSTDDATAIQNAINASITAYGDVRIYFPGGRYKVNSLLSIDNSTVNVTILGYNSTLVSGISSVGSSVLYVSSAKSLLIDKLNIDFNAQNTVHYGYRIGDESNSKYVGVCKVLNCDFYNFGTEATRGIYAAGVPFVSGLTANFNLPSLLIDGCNFYNQNTLNNINYSTATYYGYGIQLADKCDYARIANCNFNFIRIGLYNTSSGNTDVTGCNFLGCLPKTSGVYTYGCITVPNTGTNNGKINVVACKFNHNYGYSIYFAYATAERPMTVKACQFISNATTAIYCTHTSTVATRHQIHDNYFERCSQAFTNSYTNQPFGASRQPFIYLNNQLRCSIRLNTFLNDATYGVLTANSADYNLIKNNNWFNITGISSLVGANNVVSDNDNL